jgi:hypothetical protein
MIVYGDPSIKLSVGEALRRFKLGATGVDQLVMAGQIEQGLADICHPGLAMAQSLTDDRAAHLIGSDIETWSPIVRELEAWSGQEIRVKTPEGYAFYCLYPEQYVAAARQWSEQRNGTATVVGVRSIGTSLSAAVAVVLRERGMPIQRLTVRPSGDPYDRKVALPVIDSDWLVVVDEGPGHSGTSMAAVARAAIEQGFALEQIVFFPGSPSMPGHAAPSWSREIWSSVARCFVPNTEVLINGKSIEAALGGEALVNIGAGAWRNQCYAAASDWPAVCSPFEANKYLSEDSGRKTFWKYVGPTRLECPDLRSYAGYAGRPWIEGKPLSANDWDSVKERVLEYLRLRIAEPVPETAADHRGVAEMMVQNTLEALGESAAERVSQWTDWLSHQELPRAGGTSDGRVAPHDWIRDESGNVHKVGGRGNAGDHTVVGSQPDLWDYAAVIAEWGRPFALEPACDVAPPEARPHATHFYTIAYLAFRCGITKMSLDMLGNGHPEGPRLSESFARNQSRLAAALTFPPPKFR